MADRLISFGKIQKIWANAIKDNSKALAYLRDERKITNIVSPVGYVEKFKIDETFFLKDVIVFPLFGADGKLRGLNTRKTHEKFFIRILCSYYPLIYSDYEFYNKTLVLTESPLCAITLKPYLPDMEVSATLSASLTEQTLTLLSVAKKIITVLDNDEAGQRCSKLIEQCNDKAFVVPTHKYEQYKDPNDLYLNDMDSFLELVEYIKTIDRKTGK